MLKRLTDRNSQLVTLSVDELEIHGRANRAKSQWLQLDGRLKKILEREREREREREGRGGGGGR